MAAHVLVDECAAVVDECPRDVLHVVGERVRRRLEIAVRLASATDVWERNLHTTDFILIIPNTLILQYVRRVWTAKNTMNVR